MKIRVWFFILLGLLLSGCSVTPHANLSVDLRFSNGKFRLPDLAGNCFGTL